MLCSSCGNSITGNENFCPSCGDKLGQVRKSKKSNTSLKTHEFSSNILLGGSILTLDEESVIYDSRNKQGNMWHELGRTNPDYTKNGGFETLESNQNY